MRIPAYVLRHKERINYINQCFEALKVNSVKGLRIAQPHTNAV